MKHLLCSLALVFCAAHPQSVPTLRDDSPARSGKDFALFFAIDAYAEWDKLRNPVAEAKKLAAELQTNYGFEARVYENKSRSEILNILGEYRRRTYDADAQLLVFFSGHGYYDGQCIGYVVPREGKRDDAEGASYISYPDLQSRVASIPCRHILLCVDACYAGTANLAANCPELFKGPVAPGRPNQPPAAEAFIRETLREQSRAYYAAAGNTPTRDRSEFAAQFLEALQKDYDHLGLLTLSKLRDRLKYAQPRPWFGEFAGNRDAEAFVFVRQTPKTPTPSTDADGDGVPNAADRCPDQYGPAANGGCPETGANPTTADTDGDGVPNDRDACPEAYGTARANGCPDADDDSVPDLSDKCPYQAGEPRWEGCPDTDSDGVPDHLDQCPTQKGLAADKGCPPPDRDADGVPDRSDRCPDQAGKQNLQGCPDTDADGIPDVDDKCPTEKGLAALGGCPEKAAMPDFMVFVQGGTFDMGDVLGDNEQGDEKPVHPVTLSSYYIGKTEVTLREFKAFVDATGYKTDAEKGDGSYIWDGGNWTKKAGVNWRHDEQGNIRTSDNHPVIHVSWQDAVAYCNWLSERQNLTKVYTISGEEVTANWNANGYRLPTEAEWEYAARQRGQKVRFGNGKDLADPSEINFDGSPAYKKPYSVSGTYRQKTTPVGSFGANSLGLYDMSGNVWEWCWDWYGAYASGAQTNPRGPASGGIRVFRGGSWGSYPVSVRAAFRDNLSPSYRGAYNGFRLARATSGG